MIRIKHSLDYFGKLIGELLSSPESQVNGVRTVYQITKDNIQNVSGFDINKKYDPFSIVMHNGKLYYNIREAHYVSITNTEFWLTNHVEPVANGGESSGIDNFGAFNHIIFNINSGGHSVLKGEDIEIVNGANVGEYTVNFLNNYTPIDVNYDVSCTLSTTNSARKKTYEIFVSNKSQTSFDVLIWNNEDDVDNNANTVEDDIILGIILIGKEQ